MFSKVVLYFMIFDLILAIDGTQDSKIDKILTHCSSLDQKNNDPKCLNEYKELVPFGELITTIGLRLMTAHKVAVAKWDTNGTIVDPIREEQVIDNAVQHSKDMDLDPIWIKQLFRDQIDANVYIQQKLHEEWHKSGHRTEGPAVDLKEEIRPLIDRLNKELILFSNQTKHLRESQTCLQLKDMMSEESAKNLSMNSNDKNGYEMALNNICVGVVPINSHSSNGYPLKYSLFESYFTAIFIYYFGLVFK